MRSLSLLVLALASLGLAEAAPSKGRNGLKNMRRGGGKKCGPKPTPTDTVVEPPTSTSTGGDTKPTDHGSDSALPNTIVLDPKRMVDLRSAVKNGEHKEELDNILVQAKELLNLGPWTVTDKTREVPNGELHDYASQAPYWWPANWDNPSSTEVCPYVQRDGVRNPEVDVYDRRDGAAMMNSTYILSLAWWYTGDASYRAKAGTVLRTWFIDESTRMNPNLQHAQILPCKNDGRAIGIIDFSQQYTDVTDAVGLLSSVFDDAWSQADAEAFDAWNQEYLSWLTDSDFGKEELKGKNNHGTFASMQIAVIAAYLGDKDLAAQYLQDIIPRIDVEIDAAGAQPAELNRTKPFHYSTFNLVAYLRMASTGQREGVDVDLWGHTGPEGQSIQGAIKFLLPYASGEEAWPYPDLEFQRFAAYDIVHYAADMGMTEAQAVLDKLEKPRDGGTWALAPAVQQLDSILL